MPEIITLTDLQMIGLVLVVLCVGVMLGHALGYSRGKDFERRARSRHE